MDPSLQSLLISPEATLREAMVAIDTGAERICLVVDDHSCLLGVLTDGDARRGLLAGSDIDSPAAPLISANPVTVRPHESRTAVLEMMQARRLSQVPVVTDDGVLVGMHSLSALMGADRRENVAIIFAGGKGTRLGALTESVPKPMMPVAGRPILERMIIHLCGAGVTRFYLAVNYLAEVIEDHFGNGDALGCSITYLREDPDLPLGPGGALALLAAEGNLGTDEPVIALNGDLVIDADIANLLDHHRNTGAIATITARDYMHQVPFGVIERSGTGELASLAEKPTASWLINAGIYVLDQQLLARVPVNRAYTIPALLSGCLERHETVAVWEMDGDWIDVGRPDDLKLARGDV